MNWSIYGWFLLIVSILRIVLYKHKFPERDENYRFAIALSSFFMFMPLIGHLLGWW